MPNPYFTKVGRPALARRVLPGPWGNLPGDRFTPATRSLATTRSAIGTVAASGTSARSPSKSRDSRKHQKKVERRNAKRKERLHEFARRIAVEDPSRNFVATARFPILHCVVPDSVYTNGMGTVLISRQVAPGRVACAVFLGDMYACGVKDAFWNVLPLEDYESRMHKPLVSRFTPVPDVSPAYVRKLVEGAVAYARNCGFPPHPDYQKAKLLFGDIDPNESAVEFEFGKEGKPLFISGPFSALTSGPPAPLRGAGRVTHRAGKCNRSLAMNLLQRA